MKQKLKINSASIKVRPDGFNETNDCSVRATAIATNAPYELVHSFFKKRGRQDKHGVYYMPFYRRHRLEFTKEFNCYFSELPVTKRCSTYNRFITWYKQGTFIVTVDSHVACIKDGIVLDGAVANMHIKNIIQVFKKPTA